MIQELKTFYARNFAEDQIDGTDRDIRVFDTIDSLKTEQIKLKIEDLVHQKIFILWCLEKKYGQDIMISFKTGTIYKENKIIGSLKDVCIHINTQTEQS